MLTTVGKTRSFKRQAGAMIAVSVRLPASCETGADCSCITHPTRRQKAVNTSREDSDDDDDDAMMRVLSLHSLAADEWVR